MRDCENTLTLPTHSWKIELCNRGKQVLKVRMRFLKVEHEMFCRPQNSLQGHVVNELFWGLGKTPEVQTGAEIPYSNPSTFTVTISASAIILYIAYYIQTFSTATVVPLLCLWEKNDCHSL